MPLCSRVKISLEYRVDLFEGSIRFELHYVYQITLAFGIFIVYLPDILNTRDGLTVWELSLTVFVFVAIVVAIDLGRRCRLLPGLDGAGHILCRRCRFLLLTCCRFCGFGVRFCQLALALLKLLLEYLLLLLKQLHVTAVAGRLGVQPPPPYTA